VQVPLPLLDVLAEARTAFFGLCLDAGQQVLRTMMEQDRERLCGPKHVPNPERRAVRGGSTRGEQIDGTMRIICHSPLPPVRPARLPAHRPSVTMGN
jgi:putative transposase